MDISEIHKFQEILSNISSSLNAIWVALWVIAGIAGLLFSRNMKS